MAKSNRQVFFLNERHELSRAEVTGGGRPPQLAPIDWKARGASLHEALRLTKIKIEGKHDPGCQTRLYFMVEPEPHIIKLSTTKGTTVEKRENVDFGGQHSLALRRLGMDLLANGSQGAIVHAPLAEYQRLSTFAGRLDRVGKLEQSRWAPLHTFSTIPRSLRIDTALQKMLSKDSATRLVISFQPFLTKTEQHSVVREILSTLSLNSKEQALLGQGTDFSGRPWIRCNLFLEDTLAIADRFFSVQSIYEPINTPLCISNSNSGKKKKDAEHRHRVGKSLAANVAPPPLPTIAVGVVDGGIRTTNTALSTFRRGTHISPNSPSILSQHGAYVASRVVFGDLLSPTAIPAPTCLFLDIHVQETSTSIDDAAVVQAIQQAHSNYPDVRVYNLSFAGTTPLHLQSEVRRRELLHLMQDLDNLIFSEDITVVVSAGNSASGVVPRTPYPAHYSDDDWRFGHWSGGYNTVTVGSFVGCPSPHGQTTQAGAPSPFCRIGPGIGGASMPDFSSNGGDVDATYHRASGTGVLVCNDSGQWEDHIGTSFSAPLVAREFAFLLEELKRFCADNTRPYATTARAFFMLTASLPNASLPDEYTELCRRTLGRGEPKAQTFRNPSPADAVFLWQGIIESDKDIVRLEIPIPSKWLRDAVSPRLEAYVCWDTPVNSISESRYACRHVTLRVRPEINTRALTPMKSSSTTNNYPACRRSYDLKKGFEKFIELNGSSPGEIWVMELMYDDSHNHVPTQTFSEEQRVGLAFRLFDADDTGTSPYAHVSSLPTAPLMNRFSTRARLPTRVGVRTKLNPRGKA